MVRDPSAGKAAFHVHSPALVDATAALAVDKPLAVLRLVGP
jgi:hypothetical protein